MRSVKSNKKQSKQNPNPNPSVPSSESELTTSASKIIAALAKIEASLALDSSLSDADAKALRHARRLKLQVIQTATDFLAKDPGQYPAFDVEGAKEAIAYESAMAAVAKQARALARNVETSILKRRAKAANQSLALYAAMKGVARLPSTPAALRDVIAEIEKLVRTRVGKRKPAAAKGASQNGQPAPTTPALPAAVPSGHA